MRPHPTRTCTSFPPIKSLLLSLVLFASLTCSLRFASIQTSIHPPTKQKQSEATIERTLSNKHKEQNKVFMERMKADLELAPGFRFHPTDDELVNHYLCRKCASQPIAAPIIAEIDLYRFDPWQLPDMASYGEKEWYFFSPRDRKYPNGCRPSRAAGSGYWKATGADKPIGKPEPVAIKKALVFYAGKAPRGVKTNWIMHEYRLSNVDRSPGKKNNNLRLDDWVLCRIYNKKGSIEKHFRSEQKWLNNNPKMEEQKQNILSNGQNMKAVSQQPSSMSMMNNDLLQTDSCSSEQVLSPEITCEKEVQSEPKWNEPSNALDFQFNYMDGFPDDLFASQVQLQMDQFSTLPNMFSYLQKPF